MTMIKRTPCVCESSYDLRDRVVCFARAYNALRSARGLAPVGFDRYRRVEEIRYDEIAPVVAGGDGVTAELVESLIVQQLIKTHAADHPLFARDTPSLDFKANADFFNTL